MRVTIKLALAVLFGVMLIIAVDGYIVFQREVRLFESDMRRDAHLVGGSVRRIVQDVWATEGEARAIALAQRADPAASDLVRIRWVSLDPAADKAFHPRVPLARLGPVARGQELSVRQRRPDGEDGLYTYVPLRQPNGRVGAIEVAESLAPVAAFADAAIKRLWILTLAMLAASLVLVIVVGVTVVGRPLQRIIEKTRRIGAGDLSGPLAPRGRDELSELARTLNVMCDQIREARELTRQQSVSRLQALEQLRHADRLATVGQLAAGLAHELGTPLNVISGRAELIEAGHLSEAGCARNARTVREQANRMAKIVRQLLDFARQRTPRKVRVDLDAVVRRTLKLLTPEADKRGVSLQREPAAAPVIVAADPEQLEQVFVNLVINAIHAAAAVDGRVWIGAAPSRPESGEPAARVTVDDNGAGIDADILPHVFEPFFTTKAVGNGTGLGLSIAYGIIQEHGGRIDVSERPGGGSRFAVVLPHTEGAEAIRHVGERTRAQRGETDGGVA